MITNEILKNIKHVHFIGIGGSGMYPLVQIFHSKGYFITGSDNNETETLEAVRKLGIEVFLGQRAENIKGADLIIYTKSDSQRPRTAWPAPHCPRCPPPAH